jgi:hypothetical protein
MFSLATVAGATLLALAAPQAGGPQPKTPGRPADALQVTAEVPGRVPTLAEVNAGGYAVMVRLKNTGQGELVLWPYLGAEVRGGGGARVPPSLFIGRFGRRRGDKSVLEETPFLTLRPGEAHEFKFTLRGYDRHPLAQVAWELPSAGRYTFRSPSPPTTPSRGPCGSSASGACGTCWS